MFSAYDIKKIIPRAVLALVAINLSWSLMDIFIRAVEALGDTIGGIITAPFAGIAGVDLSGTGNTFSLALAALITVGALSVGLGLIPVLGVALAGVTGLGLAFIIVMIRKVALIGLVLVAPVAIAAGILPQTESWFKKWWDWFSKLLLMYPFIVAFFALSKVASGIISRGGDSGVEGMIYQIAAVVIIIAPYFLIGKAFSLAGGTIGKLAGVVNNRDKGLIDKTKKWEAGKVAERRSDSKGAGRFDNGTLRGRAFNRPLRRIMNPGSINPLSSDSSRRAALDAGFAQSVANLEELRPLIKTLTGDENEILARSQGSRRLAQDAIDEKAREARRNAVRDLLHNNPTASAAEQQREGDRAAEASRQQWEDTLASATRKAGSLDAVAAAYSLPKAIGSGNLSAVEGERLGQNLGQTVGGTNRVGVDLGNTLAGGGRKAATEAGHLVVGQSGEGRTQDQNVDRALQRSSLKQLGGQTNESAEQMAVTLTQRIQNNRLTMDNQLAAGDTVGAQATLNNILQDVAHVDVVSESAGKEGNARAQGTINGVIAATQADLTAAETAAAAAGLNFGAAPTATPGTPAPLAPASLREGARVVANVRLGKG